MRFRSASLMLCGLLAACGGGSAGGPTALPTAASTTPSTGQAHLRLTIPASQATSSRRRAFVGSDAAGITVGVGPHGGTLTTTAFALSGSTCQTSGSVRSCTIVVNAPFGNDDFAISIYDAAPVNGTIPATAHLLGTAVDSSVSIQPGAAVPTIALVVAAQIGTLAVGSAMISFPADGSAHTGTVVVTPSDFNDQPISGTGTAYANPISISLSESGGSGHTVLTVGGIAAGTSTTLNSSSQSLGIRYDGAGASGYYATVTLSASGATSAGFVVVPMFVTTASPYFSSGAVAFTAAGQQASFNVSEPVGNNAYTGQLTAGCAATVSGAGNGSAGNLTLTSTSAAASPCAFDIVDALGATYAIPYTTTTSALGGITIGGISEYTIAAPSNARVAGIGLGPDGYEYVAEDIGNDIDKFAPSGTYTQYPIPTSNASPDYPTTGPDGAVWFVEKGSYKVARMTTNGGFTEYTLPNYTQSFPQALAFGRDGDLYVLDRGNAWIVQMTVQGAVLAEYSLPGSATPVPYGLVSGSDGRLYTFDSANNDIDAVSTSGAITQYPVPTASAGVSNLTSGPSGNIWFTESNTNKIGSMTVGGAITEYPIGQGDQPAGIVMGPDGNIWFCAPGSNSIGRFNVSTLTFAHAAIPSASASPSEIAAGPDGRLWFTEFNTNNVGVFTP